MPRTSVRRVAFAVAVGAAVLLSACAETRLRDAPDFGEAVREDRVAQIANPDAHYAGTPDPGANGRRVDGAQERYVRDRVLQPPTAATSDVAGASGGGGSGGGASQ